MSRLNYVIFMYFYIVKFTFVRPHYLHTPEFERDEIGLIHNQEPDSPVNNTENSYSYHFGSKYGFSLLEIEDKKGSNHNNKSKGKRFEKVNGTKRAPNKGKKRMPKGHTKGFNRKYAKYNNDKSNNSRKSTRCFNGKRCKDKVNKKKSEFRKIKDDQKSNMAPIRSHNSFIKEIDEEDVESKSQVVKKSKINPKIKNFAISPAKKVSEYGLPAALNLANGLLNKNDTNSDDEDKSNSDTELEDLFGNEDVDEKDNSDSDDDDSKFDDDVNEVSRNKEKEEEDSESDDNNDDGEDDSESLEEDEKEYESAEDKDDVEDELDSDMDDNEETDDEFEYEENQDEENEKNSPDENEEEEEDDEYTKRFKTPSGLEYLGSGYDLIKGNPLGDNITMLDPGYKSSIIQMHWNKRIENISNSLRFLQPVGGWIRPYSSCHKVESVTEINSSDSLLRSLSADASVSLSLPGDVFKFSASAKYKKLDDASKSGRSKMFINKSYCFKYVAGISTSLKWDFTLGFQSSLKRLSESFRGLEKDSGCEPFIYRQNPKNEICEELGVTDWMELFNIFGTHVATKIYLGGKIFTTLEVKKDQEKKLNDQGMDVKAILSAKIKETNIDSNVEVSVFKSQNSGEYLMDTKKSTFVLGGDIYGHGKTIEFGEWAKSVTDHAMPIKAEFTPISHFIDKKFNEAYNKAYLYYGKVIMESDFLRYQSQAELTPEEMINDIEIESSQGKGAVKVSCKDGKSIQFGFILISKNDKTYEVRPCPVQSFECLLSDDENIFHSTIWIGCRIQNLVNLKQIVTVDKEPSCDSGFNILLGSYFLESKSNYLLMKPCKIGNNFCGIENQNEVKFTWLDANSKSKVVKRSETSSISCKRGEIIAFGIGFEWIKNKDGLKSAGFFTCKRDENACSHKCPEYCNRIVQYIACK